MTKKFEDFLTEMGRVSVESGHRTVWATGDTSKGKFFVYFSLVPEKARLAEQLLRDANLLCDTVLKTF